MTKIDLLAFGYALSTMANVIAPISNDRAPRIVFSKLAFAAMCIASSTIALIAIFGGAK